MTGKFCIDCGGAHVGRGRFCQHCGAERPDEVTAALAVAGPSMANGNGHARLTVPTIPQATAPMASPVRETAVQMDASAVPEATAPAAASPRAPLPGWVLAASGSAAALLTVLVLGIVGYW